MLRDNVKRLLLLLAGGVSLNEAWKQSGFSSRDEAVAILHRLGDALDDSSLVEHLMPALTTSPAVERGSPFASLIIYVDGASRGNPGPSAIAAIAFLPTGELLTSRTKRIGLATNNIAEYKAVLEGMHVARDLGAHEVEIRLDSELVAKQLSGEYRIKNNNLRVLAGEVAGMAAQFRHCIYKRIQRNENKEADKLANKALDEDDGV